MTDKLWELLNEIPPTITIWEISYSFIHWRYPEYYTAYSNDWICIIEFKRDTHYKAVKAIHIYLKVKWMLTQGKDLDNKK